MGEHALLSASSAHRWLYCTPSARLEEQFPDGGSEAAREGTLAHELAELKLRNYFFTTEFGKRKLNTAIKKLKEKECWADEMMGYTDDYLDYVKALAMAFPAMPSVRLEQRVSYTSWASNGFGTADCILMSGGVLHIVDFKYGKGVPVSAEGNPQMALYALGAYDSYRMLYPIDTIRFSIVQPRLTDGITEWECSLKELLAWGEWAKGRAQLAWEGKGDYAPGEKTCRFCRAKAQCRARSDQNIKLAFSAGELPPLITAREAGERLMAMEDVVKYQKDLQEWALSECLAGGQVPGWKAVEGRTVREWSDMDQAFTVLQKHSIPEAVLYERVPLTLAQTEKVVGKTQFSELVGQYAVKKPGKPALVKEQDKRPVITNKITAEQAFKEEKEI